MFKAKGSLHPSMENSENEIWTTTQLGASWTTCLREHQSFDDFTMDPNHDPRYSNKCRIIPITPTIFFMENHFKSNI